MTDVDVSHLAHLRPLVDELALEHDGDELVRAVFAHEKLPTQVDHVAALLDLPRDEVNAAAPWAWAELDQSNSDLYLVELAGDPVEWDWREGPDYYDEDGHRRDGVQAPKLVKPHFVQVQLRARTKAEAERAALATHPELHTILSAQKLEG